MKSWLELEQRFRAIMDPLRMLRLDHQWGAAGEYWHITGMERNQTRIQFESLCELGGTMLERCVDEESILGNMLFSEPNSVIRWLKALKEISGGFRFLNVGTQIDEQGNPAGNIFMESLDNIVEVSANACLTLHAQYPCEDETMAGVHIHIGNIGLLNTGQIKNVESIQIKLGTLQQSGHAEFAEAVKQVVEAVTNSKELSTDTRTEVLEQLDELSKQALLEPESRLKPGAIKGILLGIGQSLSAGAAVAQIWSTWGQKISAFFGF